MLVLLGSLPQGHTGARARDTEHLPCVRTLPGPGLQGGIWFITGPWGAGKAG